MATTVITGRDITLTIATVNYGDQALSAELAVELERNAYETIDGKQFFALDTTATLSVTMLADWGAASSLLEAMWTAASSAPNTALAYSFTSATGAVFTGNVFPVAPTAGGAAPDAQTDSWSMLCSTTPTGTFS